MSDERDKNDLHSTSSVRTVLNACVFEKRSHSLINHKCSCFRHTCTLARLLTHTSRRIGRILTRCIIGTYRCTDPNACTHTRKQTHTQTFCIFTSASPERAAKRRGVTSACCIFSFTMNSGACTAHACSRARACPRPCPRPRQRTRSQRDLLQA